MDATPSDRGTIYFFDFFTNLFIAGTTSFQLVEQTASQRHPSLIPSTAALVEADYENAFPGACATGNRGSI